MGKGIHPVPTFCQKKDLRPVYPRVSNKLARTGNILSFLPDSREVPTTHNNPLKSDESATQRCTRMHSTGCATELRCTGRRETYLQTVQREAYTGVYIPGHTPGKHTGSSIPTQGSIQAPLYPPREALMTLRTTPGSINGPQDHIGRHIQPVYPPREALSHPKDTQGGIIPP